jgi:hypothetical protein
MEAQLKKLACKISELDVMNDKVQRGAEDKEKC